MLLCNCNGESKKENISNLPIFTEEIAEKKNEIVIAVHDSIQSFFTNLFVSDFQDKPDMLFLGKKENRLMVTVPTESSIRIIGGDPFVSFQYEIQLEKGDSLLIGLKTIKISKSKQIDFPIFEIPNSNRKWGELNFEYLMYEKNLKNRAIRIDTTKRFPTAFSIPKKVLQNSIQLLDSLKAKKEISEDFYVEDRLNQKIKFATGTIRKANNNNQSINIDTLELSLNDQKEFNNKEYINYLRTVILYKYFRNQKRVSNTTIFDFIAENNTFLEDKTKPFLLDSYLNLILRIEKNKFDEYLGKFNSSNTNIELRDKWQSVVSNLNSNTEKFNLANRNIGTLTNLVNDNELIFEQVLANQKGKVVLIDFWASWCSPCRKEMPYLKELKSKFTENELQVIEISIDENYAAWERASKIEKINDRKHNYIIANWKKSNLYKNYDIKTIPRYLLFDKNGKIIDDDAPRPRSKELIDLIKASLKDLI